MSAGVNVTTSDDRRFEQLRRLTEISRALTYTTSLDQVLRLTVERAAELLEAPQAILMLRDTDGLLHVRAAIGVADELIRRFREPLDETVLFRLQGLLGAVANDAFIGVPLVAQGEVTGLLAVVRADGPNCSEEDEWLLSALADQAAVALENARLAGEMRQELQARTRGAPGVTDARENALAVLSHDLRTPLNAIDSYAELLEMEIYGPLVDRQREPLGRIRMSGRHLLAVLDNVMQMTRLSAGVVQMTGRPVRLDEVIDDALKITLPTVQAKEQLLSTEITPGLIVRADADGLRQTLLNLLGNAVKYTPAKGLIGIRASSTGSEVRIAVEDTGAGIPPDQMEVIFEPYRRLPHTASEPGVGLGLAISKELVRQMGGELNVTSRLGQGSTFTIVLPLEQSPD
jgi:sigma-B regulation protein RsbU (phosphoserine phosphatase)